MRVFAKKKHLWKVVGVFLLIFVIGVELFIVLQGNAQNNNLKGELLTESEVQEYAAIVKQLCKDKPYKPSCYDNEIPKLMDEISMEDAFRVTKEIQDTDKDYAYCHVLGHKLSGREVEKDPSAWRDVMTRCPTTICNNGCLHGPLLKRFASENLTDEQIERIKPEIKDACEPRGEWNPVGVEISMCYHGMGHLNMYITQANIEKSIELCEFEALKSDGRNYLQTCLQGLFMQVFQALEPEDFALIKDITQTKDTAGDFCNQYTGEARGACIRESWVFYREEIVEPQGLIAFCSYSNEAHEQQKCYSGAMSYITVAYIIDKDDPEGLKDFCNALPKEQSGSCFGHAAVRLIQIDPTVYHEDALNFCKLGGSNSSACYALLARFASDSFHRGSEEFNKFCNSLPTSWISKCYEGVN